MSGTREEDKKFTFDLINMKNIKINFSAFIVGMVVLGCVCGVWVLNNFLYKNKLTRTDANLWDRVNKLEETIESLSYSLQLRTDSDIEVMLKGTLKGIAFVYINVHDEAVHLLNEEGGTQKIIEVPEKYKQMGEKFDYAKLSPNQEFILLGIGISDAGPAWIYDITNDEIHELDVQPSAIRPIKWLANNQIEIYEGCVSVDHCKRYQSVDIETPWKLNVVEDVSRYE